MAFWNIVCTGGMNAQAAFHERKNSLKYWIKIKNSENSGKYELLDFSGIK